jgi:uncharacterized coiled-coil protein SlyX
MPTQEERVFTLEQSQAKFAESITDLNHHVTMMTGIMSREEWDIREIKTSLRSVDGRLDSFDRRLESLEGRFEKLEGRFGTVDNKLDQVLLLLNTSIRKSE